MLSEWQTKFGEEGSKGVLARIMFLYIVCQVLIRLGSFSESEKGWLGGAMVLAKLPVPGRPTI